MSTQYPGVCTQFSGFLFLGFFLSLVIFITPTAVAAPLDRDSTGKLKPSAETVRLFGEHVSRGLEDFRQERWDEALKEYWAAYDINPVPLLLFNAAQANRRAGRWKEALSLYQRFLAEDPQNPVAPEAEAHASAMRANRDRDKLNLELTTAQQVAESRTNEAARLADLNRELRDNVNQMLVAGKLTARRPHAKRTWVWGVVGGGAAALALALGLGIGLQSMLPTADLGAHRLSF